MTKYSFKTNLNCGGCLKAITPELNALNLDNWSVDLGSPDKILTVQTTSVSREAIRETVEEAGFWIEDLL